MDLGPQAITGSPPGAAVGRAAEVIDLLLTVGHIDGVFHQREQTFVRRYLESVLAIAEDLSGAPPDQRTWIRTAYQAHFDTLYTQHAAEIARLTLECPPAADGTYLSARLKERAVATFAALPSADQTLALELVRALLHADGLVTEPEQLLYAELLRGFVPPTAGPTLRSLPRDARGHTLAARPMVVLPPQWNPLKALAHPLLEPLEQTYSPHPVELQSQLALDYQLVHHVMNVWRERRTPGHGLLTGVTDIDQIPAGAQFLDRHIHVLRPRHPVELVVLGDLHGCYACLKAALLQSDFVNRVWLHQWDPRHYPDVKLVLLGDYIDRGRFSFDGVLRAVMQLLVAMPDNVFMLRGNHEYFLTGTGGQIFSGVHPAEGLSSIVLYAPRELLEAYQQLFEQMPTALLFDRTLFVHGGIPRDDSLATHYRDLSSLGDSELRFQMLWSDPAPAEVVPTEVQRHSARFQFGRQQFRAFMERTGCHTLIRGHEQIEAGFDVIYDLGDRQLLSLFSAGGHDNRDLPLDSSYRKVRPMALTIRQDDSGLRATPWPIEYQPFNYEVRNGLYRPAPVLEYRYH